MAERLATELGVRDHVRVLGHHESLEVVLQASDLFILPSQTESFGLAALEALACGTPVLSYHVGGLPEVIEDGVSGLLCPDGQDACLGTIAAELLEDSERYQAMRIAARKRAEQFAMEPIVDAYERALSA